MTKVQQKAAEVAQKKWEAYRAKVGRLTGQLVYSRLDETRIRDAFAVCMTAEDFAAEVAAMEPVGKVVWPLKAAAVARAAVEAQKVVDRVREELEAAGWDRNAVAPYPSRMAYGSFNYEIARSKYQLFSSLTREPKYTGSMNGPKIVEMCDEYVAKFIAGAERDAAEQYDAFTCKLVAKVGDVTEATLEGDHIWGFSLLTVTTVAGEKQVWKTQQIVNVSKLGKLFNQWPTRKMK